MAGEIAKISHNIDQNVLCKLFYGDLIMNEEKDPTRELYLLWLSSWCFTNSRPQWLDCPQSALIFGEASRKIRNYFPTND
jgi:hypothetical protein